MRASGVKGIWVFPEKQLRCISHTIGVNTLIHLPYHLEEGKEATIKTLMLSDQCVIQFFFFFYNFLQSLLEYKLFPWFGVERCHFFLIFFTILVLQKLCMVITECQVHL